MAIWVSSKLTTLNRLLACSLSSDTASSAAARVWKKEEKKGVLLVAVNCLPRQQTADNEMLKQEEVDEGVGIMCEPCNGRGWILCDFCKGQKTLVKADNNRIYRRCPNCRAVGCVLCSKCKVFKCVTYPDYTDGEI